MKNLISDIEHNSDLLCKKLSNGLTDREEQELQSWLEERPEREKFLGMLQDADWLQTEREQMKAIDTQAAITTMRRRIAAMEEREATASRSRRLRLWLLRVAAAAVLFVAGGTWWWYNSYTKVTPPVVSQEIRQAIERSKDSGAQGATIISAKQRANRPAMTQKELKQFHVEGDAAAELLAAIRVTTRYDKEFWLTLDDGTLVHLNYNTRLIYPEHFGRGTRDVILEGEAYFMVAKDRSRRFIVHTPQGDVRVYGTEFMVNTRNEQQEVTSVVLVRGSVGVTPTGGHEQMMRPGQQFSMLNSQLSITEVDTAPYVAWNEGKFQFHEWTLERIMSVMARWYGKQPVFANDKLKQLTLSGNFDRYEDILSTMEALETVTGLQFDIEKDKIIIH